MKKIWDIVLTGGPCSGKTTALATIEKELTARGYHVIIVPETASELISNGVRPFGNNALDNVSFQTLLMQQQYNKEKIYSTAAAQIPNNQTVIVYDRGILDSKCYMSQDEFDYVLREINNEDIIDEIGVEDAFFGGFLSGYMKGYSLYTCLKKGNDVANITLKNIGCTFETKKEFILLLFLYCI